MFTIDEIGNSNMSTMTTTGTLISSFKAVRIWATPINSEIPLTINLNVGATMLIPVDSTMDITTTDNMVVFLPGKGSKPIITWNKSDEKPLIAWYGGKYYYLLQTKVMGFVAIGNLIATRTTCFLQIPRFVKAKITIKSDSANTNVVFQDPDKTMIRFMPGDLHPGIKTFFITAEGVDHSGNLYILEQTSFVRFASKKKKNYFVLRKKDFEKM